MCDWTSTQELRNLEKSFNLTSCLVRLTKMTWEERGNYEIIEEGFKQEHGRYFVYVFALSKVIGT